MLQLLSISFENNVFNASISIITDFSYNNY